MENKYLSTFSIKSSDVCQYRNDALSAKLKSILSQEWEDLVLYSDINLSSSEDRYGDYVVFNVSFTSNCENIMSLEHRKTLNRVIASLMDFISSKIYLLVE